MKHRLFPKLLISYLLFFAATFAVFCTYTQRETIDYLVDTESQKLYREAALLSSSYVTKYFSNSMTIESLQMQMETISTYLSAQVWVVDSRGRVLLDSANPTIRTLDAAYSIPGFDISHFGNQYYSVDDFYGIFSKDMLTVFSPITIGFQQRGYVLIFKPVADIIDTSNGFMHVALKTLAFASLFSFLILGFFTLVVYLPLRRITGVVEHYSKGDFEKRIQLRTNDEIGYLANTIDYMAGELATLEEDQRKFISNVSHDFRSPLTSIKGFVEAMIDGTIPVEMQEKYLNIILFETERLNKLTQSLIDLNQFGRHGMMLDITDFDINDLIRTTLPAFEGRCMEKNISFDLVLTGNELWVTADANKIQQVVHNLIDNAVKFSHSSSTIKVETSIRNEKVFVSVRDSGIGIPKESIKKIWERFYKTDLSRGKDKCGTGLGLAIVKEIIQAHNQNINVISTEGVGTEFIFTLSLSVKEAEA